MESPDFIPQALKDMSLDARLLRKKLSLNHRAGLLRVLGQVAVAAGGFASAEEAVLIESAKMLDLSPDVFAKVLRSVGGQAAAPTVPKVYKQRKPRAPKPKATEQAPAAPT